MESLLASCPVASLKSRRGGFTLVEMMVVLTIITVITAVAITSQSTFNKTLILKNTAYDIALTIRSAESFGIGNRVRSDAKNAAYGIHFTEGNTIILFSDTDPAIANDRNCHGLPPSGNVDAPDALFGDCYYTPGADVLVQTYTLGNGMTISDFCAYKSDSSKKCKHSNDASEMDIVFARPDPSPNISTKQDANHFSGHDITKACITVSSPQRTDAYIVVNATGEITANADPALCP